MSVVFFPTKNGVGRNCFVRSTKNFANASLSAWTRFSHAWQSMRAVAFGCRKNVRQSLLRNCFGEGNLLTVARKGGCIKKFMNDVLPCAKLVLRLVGVK